MQRDSGARDDDPSTQLSGRREVLATLAVAVLGAACGDGDVTDGGGGGGGGQDAAGGGGPGGGPSSTGSLGGGGAEPTPSCEETESDIEGPYYTADAPLLVPGSDGRVVLSPDEPGERIVLTGTVRGAACAPLVDAELDLWHADVDGAYDNVGFTLRGRVRTLADGAFAIVTVLPGRYLNGSTYRPRHLHLKLRAAGHAELTTQLYFPGDPFNDDDAFFDPRLLVVDEVVGSERFARFDFVLAPE